MAASVRQPASLVFTRCGSPVSSESGRGERVSGTSITSIDAQPTASVEAHRHEPPELLTPETPHVSLRLGLAESVHLEADSAEMRRELASFSCDDRVPTSQLSGECVPQTVGVGTSLSVFCCGWEVLNLDRLPNELLMQILGFLDVSDLLSTSRVNHHFRTLSLAPILHTYRLQHVRVLLPPLLTSPSRPTLAELIAKHIFLTHTTQISRRLARSLVAIRLSRRLPKRPSAETLAQRGIIPPECIPGCGCAPIAPALVAKRRAVEKEKLKDGLRRWVGGVWRGEVKERSEGVRIREERAGVGRVWRLRRFWESVGRGGD
ncbi:hypothetical protein F4777DRAFT_83721 [Nemania sp. FL0916]|nr:hypothetical protein F4777DRAFT_83721 [Nemania sp. FL0916]